LDALKKLAPYQCHVLRNGTIAHELASNLVPGDLIRIHYGDRIPADARLIVTNDLDVDESSLTGETDPIRKNIETISPNDTIIPASKRKNIVFMGTLVKNGYGTAIVIGTGNDTELGAICSMMKEIEKPRTPLQKNMDDLGKQLSLASFVFISFIGCIALFQNRPWLEVFTISVSLAVAAIPEGLPIVVTVTLALGVIRMAKKKVIVKKLPAVESLGAVNVICMDKTGTITINKMTVTALYTFSDNAVYNPTSLHNPTPAVSLLIKIGNLWYFKA
jgi:Ca2+-transporting ATPase